MSPRRYSTFSHPSTEGSKGRRAIPTTDPTSSRLSSSAISGLPISPVGPVTATFSAMPQAPGVTR